MNEAELKAIIADMNVKMHAEQTRINGLSDADHSVVALREMQDECAAWESQLAALRSRRAVKARIAAEEAACMDGNAAALNEPSKGRVAFPKNLRAKWDEGFRAY